MSICEVKLYRAAKLWSDWPETASAHKATDRDVGVAAAAICTYVGRYRRGGTGATGREGRTCVLSSSCATSVHAAIDARSIGSYFMHACTKFLPPPGL